MSGPWTFDQAAENCRMAAKLQAEVERMLRDAFADFARAEESYRKALAIKELDLHEGGVAWSTVGDLARGANNVAELRRKRDICEGMKEAIVQLGWRRAADRRDAQRFADWSMRRELAEFHGETPEEAIS